jgi:hypothetical protein
MAEAIDGHNLGLFSMPSCAEQESMFALAQREFFTGNGVSRYVHVIFNSYNVPHLLIVDRASKDGAFDFRYNIAITEIGDALSWYHFIHRVDGPQPIFINLEEAQNGGFKTDNILAASILCAGAGQLIRVIDCVNGIQLDPFTFAELVRSVQDAFRRDSNGLNLKKLVKLAV